MAAVPSIGRATGVESHEFASATAAHGLYRRHYARVLGFCRTSLRTREEAEDAAQTTFCYALGALRRGVVPRAESAWLLKIARNVCLNRAAANRRRSLVEVARDPQVLQEVAPAREESDDDLPALQDALGHLTEQQRRAIVLREWHGLSYGEIADELELSRGAVETLIFRARRSLARHLRADRRLRSGVDLGSILTGLKSLLTGGGAVVKIVAAVGALATVGAIAEPRLRHELGGAKPTPAVSRPAGAPTASQSPVGERARVSRRTALPSAESPERAVPAAVAPTGAETPRPGASAPAPAPAGTPVDPSVTPSPADPPLPAVPSGHDVPSTGATAPALPEAPEPALPSAPSTPTVPSAPALPPVPETPTVPSLDATPLVPSLPAPPVSAPSPPALP